jgi:hypothetical protein
MWEVYKQLCCWTNVWYLGGLECVYRNTCAVVKKQSPQNNHTTFLLQKTFHSLVQSCTVKGSNVCVCVCVCVCVDYSHSGRVLPRVAPASCIANRNWGVETDSEIQRTADCRWADIVLRWRGRSLIDEVLKYPKLVHQREFEVKQWALLDRKVIRNTAQLQASLSLSLNFQTWHTSAQLFTIS